MEEDLGFGAVEACQAGIGITCEECRYHDVCLGIEEGSLVDEGELKNLTCARHITLKIVDICRNARLNPGTIYTIEKPLLSNAEMRQILYDVIATVGIPQNIAFVKEE